MGARQSKRSVDISHPPKKGGEVEGGECEGKMERLEEGDVANVKTTLNGTAPHAEKEPSPVTEEAQPLVNGDSSIPEVTEKKEEVEESKTEEDRLANGTTESPESKAESATPDSEKKKKKDKSKKKWSFRSISFSRKDKSKPDLKKDETKNGNLTKEESVAEVVEAVTEAIPVKEEEPKKEEEKVEVVSTTVATESTEPAPTTPATPEPAPTTPAALEPAPTTPAAPEPAPTTPTAPEPAPSTPAAPEPTPATPELAPTTPAAPELAPTTTAAPEPAPTTTADPEPAPTTPAALVPTPIVVEPTPEPLVAKEEETTSVEVVKTEELPPPLPASPPPTEAPPPTPVAAAAPDVTLHTADTECNEVVGGGGESMAEPEDMEPVLDTEDKMDDTSAPVIVPPMVNGLSEHNHKDQFTEELTEKVDIVTESLKSMIVTESIISTQVAENSEESEQTASAAE